MEALAGEWYVTVDAVDANGDLFEEDFFGMGNILIATYNTASNSSNELWVDDCEEFWEFKVKASADINAGTFTATSADNQYYDSKVTLDGKILPKAATTPSGMPADSIYIYVSFNDDPYPETYGYSHYKMTGYRYTGLAEDD